MNDLPCLAVIAELEKIIPHGIVMDTPCFVRRAFDISRRMNDLKHGLGKLVIKIFIPTLIVHPMANPQCARFRHGCHIPYRVYAVLDEIDPCEKTMLRVAKVVVTRFIDFQDCATGSLLNFAQRLGQDVRVLAPMAAFQVTLECHLRNATINLKLIRIPCPH